MQMFKNGAVAALIIGGIALAGTADAQPYDRGNHRSQPVVSIGLGNVAFGFRDGYWDNGHRWHHWRNRRDHSNYRGQSGNHYNDYNHDRDSNHGWQR
jgi:hypothetical protein